MSTFMFTYHFPKTYPQGSPDNVAAWRAWFQSMGANLADAGRPVIERRTLGNTPLETLHGGYSLVTADDIEAAVKLAEGCPGLRNQIGIEVGELPDAS
jgi:hypothetical protein